MNGSFGGLRRRTFLAASAAGLAFTPMSQARSGSPAAHVQRDLELWYDKPALKWVEALPVGNGRIGALVFGRVGQERLQLNEDTLWAGGPYDPNNPEALAALPEVRRLIDAGEFKQAADLCSQKMMAKPLSQMPYGTAGDLFFTFRGLDGAGGYRRSLDLGSALARIAFKIRGGTCEREVFASAPDSVIVVRLVARGGATLNFDVGYRGPRKLQYGPAAYQGSATEEAVTGAAFDYTEPFESEPRPEGLTVAADGPAALLVTGRNAAAEGIAASLTFAVKVAAQGDGKIAVRDGRMTVRGARAVTLLITAATSYASFLKTDGDPVARVKADIAAALRRSYAQLKARHVADYRRLFARFAIALGTPGPDDAKPTPQRIAVAEQDVAALAALYVQYARYLMISCSRGKGQAANLQGLWNEGINPPWGSKYTININTEMNYWPVDPANIGECYEPLLRMVEELSITGARTAKSMYGARGWVAHHNTDGWRATAPIDGPFWGMWPMGAAWLCNTLWDHYEYNPDRALLTRLYPLLKGASLYFIDALVEDPKGRGLVTSPSVSPENAHHPDVSLCAGPAMDRQILRDLFDRTLAAHKLVADPDAEFAATVAAKRARLPKDAIGAQGQLQEWLEDWDATAPEQHHRHVSHLYSVYPSDQINVRDTPDLVAAAKVTLNARGDMSTGWATAWRLCLWARMGDGERAYGILKGLLGPKRTYPNMFDAHPPFQIDGNFGGTAGILEMIVQSWGGEIRLLPALPKSWAEGRVRGLKVRGGAEATIAWKDNALYEFVLKGPAGAEYTVRYGDKVKALRLDASGHAAWI